MADSPKAPDPTPPVDTHKTQIQLAKIGLIGTVLTTGVAAIVQVTTSRGSANTGAVTSPANVESERVRALRESLRRQQDVVSDLRARGLTDEHPNLIAARRRMDQLQLDLAQEITASRSP